MARIRFRLNGRLTQVETDPSKRVLDLLRNDLGLTGTKEGCSIGECGACTVMFNSVAVHACLLLAGQIDGGELTTIEGLAKPGRLHPLQQSFLEHGAVQCGFCSPGMLLSAYALLREKPDATHLEIHRAIAGNLCRCTGYKQIVDAVSACVDTGQAAPKER